MTRQMQNAAGTSAAATLVIASPFILFLYPMALVTGGTSEFPVVLGRYSQGLAAFILMALLLYVVFAVALFRRSVPILALSLLALVAITYAVAASNTITAAPGTLVVLAVTRLAAAIALAVVAALGMRGGRARWGLSALSAAALLFVPSTIDAAYLAWQTVGTPANTVSIGVGYRTPYDLNRLSDHDIVLVGDSFIWGQGVEVSQRVGDVLEARLRQQDPKAKVYSLGAIGAGLNDYVNAIREIPPSPKVRRLVISFYQNDMPPRDTLAVWMERLSLAMGRSSISARLLLDIARLSFAPTVDGYIELILGDFDETGAGFANRWKLLITAFDELFALASQRSLERPVLVIVPMLSATEGERWLSAHRRVAAAAKAAGFDVLDLYGDFRTGTPRALAYRLTANDPHFSVEGNRLFADKLFQALGNAAPVPRRP